MNAHGRRLARRARSRWVRVHLESFKARTRSLGIDEVEAGPFEVVLGLAAMAAGLRVVRRVLEGEQ